MRWRRPLRGLIGSGGRHDRNDHFTPFADKILETFGHVIVGFATQLIDVLRQSSGFQLFFGDFGRFQDADDIDNGGHIDDLPKTNKQTNNKTLII